MTVPLAGCIGGSQSGSADDASDQDGDQDSGTDTGSNTNDDTDTGDSDDGSSGTDDSGPDRWSSNFTETGTFQASRVPPTTFGTVSDVCDGLAHTGADFAGPNTANLSFEVNETTRSIALNLTWDHTMLPQWGAMPSLEMCLYNATGGFVTKAWDGQPLGILTRSHSHPKGISLNVSRRATAGTWNVAIHQVGVPTTGPNTGWTLEGTLKGTTEDGVVTVGTPT